MKNDVLDFGYLMKLHEEGCEIKLYARYSHWAYDYNLNNGRTIDEGEEGRIVSLGWAEDEWGRRISIDWGDLTMRYCDFLLINGGEGGYNGMSGIVEFFGVKEIPPKEPSTQLELF